MRSFRLLAVVAALACAASTAGANPFTYTDFSSTAGLQLNKDAHVVSNALRLSNAVGSSSGSAFTTSTTTLGPLNSFSTYFQFRILNSGGTVSDPSGDGAGADGLVFVIQPVNNNVGGAGGGIGYQGIPNSLGIEFDTWQNGEYGDPNGNHVGVDLNGGLTSLATANEAVRFNDGQTWNVWIDYNGATNGLELRYSLLATRPATPQLAYSVNLQTVLGTNSAYIGFTSAGAAAWGDHDILTWQFRDQFAPIGGDPVPEPASAFVLVAALGAFGAGRRVLAPRPAVV